MTQSESIISKRLKQVKPSASIAAKAKVDALREAGREIIDFTHGEPDYSTPKHITDAAIKSLLEGDTHYTPSAGIKELRLAITDKLRKENNLKYDPSEVVVGNGAKQIIYNAFTATLNYGDEVIVPAPYWVSYPEMVVINGGKPVIVDCPAKSGFKLTPEALESSITPKTRWLILNSPNNPTGAVYSVEELSELAKVLMKHPQVWVMSDELYEHFIYGETKHVSIVSLEPELRQRSLVINGASKSYAMTGWRIGYGAGPKELIDAITLLITQSTTCISSFAQKAAVAALTGSQDCVAQSAQLFLKRRDLIVEKLGDIPGIQFDKPVGAFYLLASVKGLIGLTTPSGKLLTTDRDVADYFIEQAGVVTVDGSSYGLFGYLRFSFATSENVIEKGCVAISAAAALLSQREEQ